MQTSTSTTPDRTPVSDAADRAHLAVDQAAQSVTPVLERASGAAHRTIDKAAGLAAAASDNAADVVARSNAVIGACTSYARAHPLVLIAAVLGLGYCIGRLRR